MNENQNNDIEKLLQDAAEKINPNVMFASRLENELKQAHKPRRSFRISSLKQALSFLAPAVALVAFAFLVVIVIQKMQPSPKVAAPNVPTQTIATSQPKPTPNLPKYDYYGTTFYLGAKFPPVPESINIYAVQAEQPATVESARALAQQFKMNGAIYQLDSQSGIPALLGGETEYLVVDGNRQLRVRSDRYFQYIPDSVAWASYIYTANSGKPTNAEAVIADFMQSYGFTSGYEIQQQDDYTYVAIATSPDGLLVLNDNFGVNGLKFSMDQNVITQVVATILSYDKVASAGVISPEDAFQSVLDPGNLYGHTMDAQQKNYMMVGDTLIKPEDIKQWTHARPLDQPITYNGWMSATSTAVDGGASLVLLDGYPVIGNVSDIPENMSSMYVEVQGQFHDNNGVKTFELTSWKISDIYEEHLSGKLQRAGDQVEFVDTDEKKYLIEDLPAEISLPMDPAFVVGMTRGDTFDWNTISNTGGGGGGGGGGGDWFFALNLSGTPVPFPVLTEPTPTPISPQAVNGLRGTLQINIFQREDGTKFSQYLLTPYADNGAEAFPSTYLLKGNVDGALDSYNNRPIDVWGAVGGSENGDAVLTVDRYEIPYPDITIQMFYGTQQKKNIDGTDVTLITTDEGATYIALLPSGYPTVVPGEDVGKAPNPDGSATPVQDDPYVGRHQYEVLIVPDETVLGYPGMRVFNSAAEVRGDGTSISIPITSDQPNIFPGVAPQDVGTIEKIELVYYVIDQRYPQYTVEGEPQTGPVYIQPVWRFSGRYENGSAFEIFAQALKRQFLLPPPPTPN